MFLAGIMAIGMGRLTDRIGPRLVLTSSGLFLSMGYLLLTRINAVWQLYLFFGVIVAIGMSAIIIPLLSTVAKWFVKKRGFMSGVVTTGAGIGTVIMPPLASFIILNYGWRTSFMIIGLSVLSVIMVAQFFKPEPRQLGLSPCGEEEVKQESVNTCISGLSLWESVRTRQYWMLSAMYFGFGFSLNAVLVHIVPHAIELGIDPISAANILSFIGGVSIIGRLAGGSAGDRIGSKVTILLCFILMSISLSFLMIATEFWMLSLFAAVFGLCFGGLLTLLSLITADLFGLKSHGVIFACINFSFTAGSAVGPILAGYIFDITTSYFLAFLSCASLSFVSLVINVFLRPTAAGYKSK
jgi:MFS family permease